MSEVTAHHRHRNADGMGKQIAENNNAKQR
jgi:hypothetical protein